MKKYLAIFLIALIAVSLVSAAGVVSAGKGRAVTRTLDTPQLLTPTDGVLVHRGDYVTLSWTAVNHATTYTIVSQGRSPTSSEWVPMDPQTVTPTSNGKTVSWTMPTPYPGGQTGLTVRWQVVASNTGMTGSWARASSAPSDVWRTMSFAD